MRQLDQRDATTGSTAFWSARTGVLRRALTFLGWIYAIQKNRKALRELLQRDDRMLADIGISRSEIEAAVSTPLHWDPMDRLPPCRRHGRSSRR
jgi:uncharacterized protein YjiS (DUF1127 family)